MEDLESDSQNRSTSPLRNSRCRCCSFSCFGSRRPSTVGLVLWDRIRTAHAQRTDQWWARALFKIREWSEIVAGPSWKTFIRKFNRSQSGGDRHGKFHYDPCSYSLNFDEGPGQNGDFDGDADYGSHRSFSTRYAAVKKTSPGTKSFKLDSCGCGTVA